MRLSRKNCMRLAVLWNEISSKSASSHCKLVELIDAQISPGRTLFHQKATRRALVETRIVHIIQLRRIRMAQQLSQSIKLQLAQPSATEFGDYDYTRSETLPGRRPKHLAEVDNGCAAYCFSTGMAAIMVVTALPSLGRTSSS